LDTLPNVAAGVFNCRLFLADAGCSSESSSDTELGDPQFFGCKSIDSESAPRENSAADSVKRVAAQAHKNGRSSFVLVI
jgi:hypothetical protein